MAKNVIVEFLEDPMSHMDLSVTNPATVTSGGEYDTLTNKPQSGVAALCGTIPVVTESFVDAITGYTPCVTNCIAELPVNGIVAGAQNGAITAGTVLYFQTGGTLDANANGVGAVPYGTAFGNALNTGNNTGIDTRTGTLVLSGASQTMIRVWVGKLANSAVGVRNLMLARFLYSFAVDGGGVGALTPAQSDWIPANALVYGGVLNVPTAVTSAGSATVALGTTAGSSANSILTATGKASLTLDAALALTCTTTPFKMSAAGQIQVTVATAALTAGILEGFVLYNMASEA